AAERHLRPLDIRRRVDGPAHRAGGVGGVPEELESERSRLRRREGEARAGPRDAVLRRARLVPRSPGAGGEAVTTPISPRLVRGGIVLVDATTGAVRRVIAMQYNPDTLTRS